MFILNQFYKTKNGSKVRHRSTDDLVSTFEVVIGREEWQPGDVFYTQTNGLGWVVGMDIVGLWQEG